jgi:hypothetical protein
LLKREVDRVFWGLVKLRVLNGGKKFFRIEPENEKGLPVYKGTGSIISTEDAFILSSQRKQKTKLSWCFEVYSVFVKALCTPLLSSGNT